MPLLSLNHDILAYITAYLSIFDAIHLTQTCKAARDHPVEPALASVTLGGSFTQLVEFRDFLVETPTRPLWLKSLTLNKGIYFEIDWVMDTAPSIAFAEILSKAVNLRHLTTGQMHRFLFHGPSVRPALTSLRKLTDLVLPENVADDAVLEAIEALETRVLRTLDIKFSGREFGSTSVSLRQLVSALAHHRSSLEEVTVGLVDGAHPSDTVLAGSVTLPNVHTISFRFVGISAPALGRIFPNAKRLWYSARSTDWHVESIATPAWASLEELHTNVAALRTWDVNFPVRWLDVERLEAACEVVLTTLEHAQPRIFSTAVRASPETETFWPGLAAVSKSVMHLELRIGLGNRERGDTYVDWLQGVSAAVVFISVRSRFGSPLPISFTDEFARTLAVNNPALVVVGISRVGYEFTDAYGLVREEERRTSRWWKVIRRGGAVDCVEIPKKVGWEVRNYMHEADYDSPGWRERLAKMV